LNRSCVGFDDEEMRRGYIGESFSEAGLVTMDYLVVKFSYLLSKTSILDNPFSVRCGPVY